MATRLHQLSLGCLMRNFAKIVVFGGLYYASAAVGIGVMLYLSVNLFDLLAIQLRWIADLLGL